MNWEIKDMRKEHGIINAYIDSELNKLSWDFELGSSFDLCAVFPWDGKMTLEDYQKKGKRPYLYHRCLKTCKSVVYDSNPHGYVLYPANLDREKNLLYIGNRACYAAIHRESQRRTIFIECIKKFFIFGPYPSKRFKLEIEQEKLYYQIIRKSKLIDIVYEADTNKGFCIYLERGEDILFFYDRSCTMKISPDIYRI